MRIKTVVPALTLVCIANSCAVNQSDAVSSDRYNKPQLATYAACRLAVPPPRREAFKSKSVTDQELQKLIKNLKADKGDAAIPAIVAVGRSAAPALIEQLRD